MNGRGRYLERREKKEPSRDESLDTSLVLIVVEVDRSSICLSLSLCLLAQGLSQNPSLVHLSAVRADATFFFSLSFLSCSSHSHFRSEKSQGTTTRCQFQKKKRIFPVRKF